MSPRTRRRRHRWAGPVGLFLVAIFVATAIAGLAHGDPLAMDSAVLQPPSPEHPFGTDNLGRDLLSRTGHGAATSIVVALGSVLAATLVAVPIGLAAAWNRNRPTDTVLSRSVEIIQVVPPFILVLVILGLVQASDHQLLGITLSTTTWLILGLALGFLPYLTRVIRSAGAVEVDQDYVQGLKLLGVPSRSILGEVLWNLVPAIAVQFLLAVSIAVFAEGGLSYLGLGTPAPAPTLGNLIAEAGSQLLDDAWWFALIPGTVLVVGIAGVNLLADAATDRALDGPGAPAEPTPELQALEAIA